MTTNKNKKKSASESNTDSVQKETTTPVKPKRKVNYLNNKDLLKEVITSKNQEKMTDKLAHMLTTLTARYAKRGNFASYTYNEDMQAYAMLMIARTWKSFNPEKSSNPFAFFTQCIKNSFIQFLNQEKKQRDIRDSLLVNSGMSASFTHQMEHEAKQRESQTDINSDDIRDTNV